jgi:hypothetical protein
MIYVHFYSMNYLTKNLWSSSSPSIDLVTTILVRNVLAGAGLVHVQLFYPMLRSSGYQMCSLCLQWAFSGHQFHQFFRHLRTLRVARFKHCGRPVHLRILASIAEVMFQHLVHGAHFMGYFYKVLIMKQVATECWFCTAISSIKDWIIPSWFYTGAESCRGQPAVLLLYAIISNMSKLVKIS